MNTMLVVLDFQARTAHRYVNRVRTHRSVIPEGFNGDDVAQLEEYRVSPMKFEDAPKDKGVA